MVGKNLTHENARIAIVNVDFDSHLLQREDGRIGLLLVAGNQDSRVAEYLRRNHDQKNARKESGVSMVHSSSFCSGMRTKPLSVPI